MKCISFHTAALLLSASSIPSLAIGGCKDAYPESKVSTALSKPEYTGCQLNRIRADYGAIVREQVKLIEFFKSAYESFLEGEPEDQRMGRIEEYERQLRRLTATLGLILPADPGAAPPNEASMVSLAKNSNVYTKSLLNMIESAKGKMDSDQLKTYCKLDYDIRVSVGMYGQLRACFP